MSMRLYTQKCNYVGHKLRKLNVDDIPRGRKKELSSTNVDDKPHIHQMNWPIKQQMLTAQSKTTGGKVEVKILPKGQKGCHNLGQNATETTI